MARHDIEVNFYATRITILVVTFAITLLLHSKRCRNCIKLCHGWLEIREQYLSGLIDGNDTTSFDVVWMNKSTFFNCSIMRQKS